MLYIIYYSLIKKKARNYQRNANQNCNEVPPHTDQNGHHQKAYEEQMMERVWRKGNAPTLLLGMQIGRATMENSIEIPQKTENRTTI